MGSFRLGKKHGKWVTFFPGGKVSMERHYRHGQRHGAFIYRSKQGDVIRRLHFRHGTGNWIEVGADGEIQKKGALVRGKRHGVWLINDSHLHRKRGTYRYGTRHGKWWWYDKKKRELARGAYKNGKRHGHWVWSSYNPAKETTFLIRRGKLIMVNGKSPTRDQRSNFESPSDNIFDILDN